MKNYRTIIMSGCLIILISCLLLGCAGPKQYRLYDGKELPTEKISVLYTEKHSSARLFRINNHHASGINGFGSFDDDSFIMELMPGSYELELGWRYMYGSSIWYSTQNHILSFDAKPGHIYRLTVETKKFNEKMWAIPKVMDVTPGNRDRKEIAL